MERWREYGSPVIGLDISRGMLVRARRRCKGSDVSLGTAEVLPFRENSFDCVSSLLAFSYLHRPGLMLEESFRVLKPGGRIAVCTLGHNAITAMVPIIYKIGERLNVHRIGMRDFNEHYYEDAEILELFEGCGFTDISVGRVSFAHVDLTERLFALSRKFEPFVEEKIPRLAYNICVSAKKPEL
jgi:ubiquinone/menaquinone biosynthesis C-methylase UbiE